MSGGPLGNLERDGYWEWLVPWTAGDYASVISTACRVVLANKIRTQGVLPSLLQGGGGACDNSHSQTVGITVRASFSTFAVYRSLSGSIAGRPLGARPQVA
jgi:hypothetical protein